MYEKGTKHSDMLSAVRNMILHSGLDYMPAKINARWPRLSYGPLVGRGQTAQREYIDIYLKTSVSAQEVRNCLEQSKPQGMSIVEVRRVPYALAGVQQLATAAVYTVEGDFSAYSAQQTIENWAAKTQLEAVQQAPNGMRITENIRPFVRQVRTLGEQKVELTLSPVAEKWINPLVCIYTWLGIVITCPFAELADERFNIIREGLYWQDSAGDLHLI